MDSIEWSFHTSKLLPYIFIIQQDSLLIYSDILTFIILIN